VKHAVKFVLYFLIMWLPLTGLATTALLCPQVSSIVAPSQAIARHQTSHHIAGMHAASPASGTHSLDCQGSACDLSCNASAIPTQAVAAAIAPAAFVYASTNFQAFSQFTPELLQRPPQAR